MEAKTWKDINLATFLKIQEMVAEPDEYTQSNLIELIYGVDPLTLPVTELARYDISFLSEEPRGDKLKSRYTIEGRDYDSNFNLSVIQVNQFIDYNNYCKDGKPRYDNLLSVFFIPHGHTYNDGYDIEQVKADMLLLPVTVALGMANFFSAQFQSCALISLTSFRRQLKGMRLSVTQRAAIEERIKALTSGGLLPSFWRLLRRLASRGRQ